MADEDVADRFPDGLGVEKEKGNRKDGADVIGVLEGKFRLTGRAGCAAPHTQGHSRKLGFADKRGAT